MKRSSIEARPIDSTVRFIMIEGINHSSQSSDGSPRISYETDVNDDSPQDLNESTLIYQGIATGICNIPSPTLPHPKTGTSEQTPKPALALAYQAPPESTTPTWIELLKYSTSFYPQLLPRIILHLTPHLLSIFSLYFISFYKSPTLTAASTLALTLFHLLILTPSHAISETVLTHSSKFHLRQDFRAIRVIVYRAIIVAILKDLIVFGLMSRLDWVLMGIG